MKFSEKRGPRPTGAVASPAATVEVTFDGGPPVEMLGTLILEKRGAQRRTRFIAKDGTERVTEWREIDHGMFAQAAELLKLWKDELLGGVGRIPPSAARVYR